MGIVRNVQDMRIGNFVINKYIDFFKVQLLGVQVVVVIFKCFLYFIY